MRKQEILWAQARAGRGLESFVRGRFLAPPQLGVPPIPRQETGSYPARPSSAWRSLRALQTPAPSQSENQEYADMISYLVGPSGVGKSRIASELAKRSGYIHENVDKIIERYDSRLFNHGGNRWDDFWLKTYEIFLRIEEEDTSKPGNVYLVDVGAGSLELDCQLKTTPILDFFKSRQVVIRLMKRAEDCYESVAKRKGGYWNGRPLGEYLAAEFSPARKDIYELGQLCDVNGFDLLQEAQVKLAADKLHALIQNAAKKNAK